MTPNPDESTPSQPAIVTQMKFTATADQVWQRLMFYEQLDQRPPLHLSLLLPVPIRTIGDKSHVGDEARCLYEGGHLIKRITAVDPGRVYAFDVIEQSLPVGGGMTLVGGEYRLDDVMSTNLAVNYSFPLRNVEIFATGEVLNVFDNDTVTIVNTSVSTAYTSGNFTEFDPGVDTPKECPQGTAGATCLASGANWQKGANFGKAASSTSYQTPRTWRFQVGLRF